MAQETLLSSDERVTVTRLAQQDSLNGRRAKALLAVDAGETQAAAAETAGLTAGQVQYFLQKFRDQRLAAFPAGALAAATAGEATDTAEPAVKATAEEVERVSELLEEIDTLVEELKDTAPPVAKAEETTYTPLGMLKLVRGYVSRYTPDVQIAVLEQFEDMSREDLMDLETWKGIAYMIAYSAQFQAGQTRERLNEQMPEPLKPDTILNFVRSTADRFTPAIAKDLAGNLQNASREDLMDPDTWKGMLYMLGYSAQFQATQTKDRLNEQLPGPLKPDTWINLVRSGVDRVTPDVARQIVASFEGATREDLLDPDTWKGVWYMLNYSLQFQAQQLRARLLGEQPESDTTGEAAA